LGLVHNAAVKLAALPLMVFIVLLAFLSGLSRAEDKLPDVLRADYEGTVGSNRIQMTLLVQHGKLIPPSHYFYQKDRTDIPLSGTTGTTLTLIDPSGGTFSLEFKESTSGRDHQLGFEENVGLVGTWTGNDGHSYPVALRALFAGPAPAQPADCHCPE
jgi:hypothetical protein